MDPRFHDEKGKFKKGNQIRKARAKCRLTHCSKFARLLYKRFYESDPYTQTKLLQFIDATTKNKLSTFFNLQNKNLYDIIHNN